MDETQDSCDSQNDLANGVAVITPNDPETKKEKVKITHPKKSSSAYNLFARYNRIIQASSDTLDEIPTPSYGLENVDIAASPMLMMAPDEEIVAYRKEVIRRTLIEAPPNDGAATHKHSDKPIPLSEQSRLMGKKWNETDEMTKSIFRELARENRERRKLAEFEMFKEASARFYIKPLFNKEDCQVKDKAIDNSGTAEYPHSNDPDDNYSETDETKPDTSAKFPIAQPFGKDARQVKGSSAKGNFRLKHPDKDQPKTSECDEPTIFPFDQVPMSVDWTPLPFNRRCGEMNLVEFHSMLSNFDWA